MTDPLLISIHFPKAGGSSLRKQLVERFGSQVLEDYGDDPVNPISPPSLDPRRFFSVARTVPDNVKAVHGHFPAAKYWAVDNAIRFTFLREPIDNLLSIYFYWLRNPPDLNANPLHHLVCSQNLTILECAQLPLLQALASGRYFGHFDMACLDFIGFHERRREDLPRLSSLLGIPFDVETHENAISDEQAEQRDAILSNSALTARLRDILTDDVRFYEDIREKYD